MKILPMILLVLVAAAIFGCSSADNCVRDYNRENFSISISKGGCFGQCPVYIGTVHGDMSVTFSGRANVENEGDFKGTVNESTLCNIIAQVIDNKLMDYNKTFIDDVPDAPLNTVVIMMNGKKNTITWKIGASAEVKKLNELLVAATLDNKSLVK